MQDSCNRTGQKLFVFGSALLICVLILSCGYRPVGKDASLPQNFTKLALPLMENETIEAGLEDIFTSELRRQFLADPRVDVVPLDEADVALRGKIEDLDLITQSIDMTGRISAQRVRVRCEFELVHRDSKKILWRSGSIEAEEEFPVTNDYLMNERYLELALAEVAEDITETAHEFLLSGF